ncbi:hypothetical protein H0X09_03370 [Candidatus Saccharibacteria bacterium]|nr:hypothetical protein [Candidatus Saccharibacteria bacterium]
MRMRRIKTSNRNRNRGDTLVEVLLSIAIVGLAIASSYALATRALRQAITASERTEALKIAEGQVESLKFRQLNSSPTNWAANFVEATNFCLDTSAITQNQSTWAPVQNPGSDPTTLTAANYDLDTCAINRTGYEKYFINISIAPGLNAQAKKYPTYLVKVTWDGINGSQNQSQLYFRF